MLNLEMLRTMGMLLAKQAREKVKEEGTTANEVIELTELLTPWEPGTMESPVEHEKGEVCVYAGMPWVVVTPHTHHGETGWEPGAASALYALKHGTDAAHALPFVAEGHNPYMTGEWCTEEGTAYRCKRDNVVHAPGVLPEAWEVETEV